MKLLWGLCILAGLCLLARTYGIPLDASVGIGFDERERPEQVSNNSNDIRSSHEDPTLTALLSEAERLGFSKDMESQLIILVSQKKRTAYVYSNGDVILTSEVRIPESIPPYANRLARLGPFNPCDGGYSRPECDIHPKFSGNSKIPGTPENASLLGPIAISIEGSQSFLVHGVPSEQRLLEILGDYTSGCVAFRDSAALRELYNKVRQVPSSWLLYATSG